MNAAPIKAPILRGGRGTTEVMDLSDAGAAYAEFLQATGDSTAAAIMAAGALIAEAVREAQGD